MTSGASGCMKNRAWVMGKVRLMTGLVSDKNRSQGCCQGGYVGDTGWGSRL